MSILNKSHLIIKKKFTTKKNKKERTAVNKGHKIIWKLTDFNHFLSFFPSFFFSEFTTAKEDHVSRAVTEIFIIFQRFLFTSVKRQSSVNAIKRCKRLWKRDTTFWARLTLSRHSRRNPFIPVTSVRLSVFILQNAGIWNKKKRGRLRNC